MSRVLKRNRKHTILVPAGPPGLPPFHSQAAFGQHQPREQRQGLSSFHPRSMELRSTWQAHLPGPPRFLLIHVRAYGPAPVEIPRLILGARGPSMEPPSVPDDLMPFTPPSSPRCWPTSGLTSRFSRLSLRDQFPTKTVSIQRGEPKKQTQLSGSPR